jgi:ABC-type phosphate transport system substrate-binding protein
MKELKNIRLFSVAMFVVVMLMSACPVLAEESVLICNKDVPDSSLSKDEVEQIFLGRKTRWGNGQKINFVVMNGGEVHADFLKKYVSKTESQFTMFWKKMVFTGKGSMPKAVTTSEEVLKYVGETPGAIGYVPSPAANDTVKVISVN